MCLFGRSNFCAGTASQTVLVKQVASSDSQEFLASLCGCVGVLATDGTSTAVRPSQSHAAWRLQRAHCS